MNDFLTEHFDILMSTFPNLAHVELEKAFIDEKLLRLNSTPRGIARNIASKHYSGYLKQRGIPGHLQDVISLTDWLSV